ncbi:MAG: O-acetyl-ADP-ribose deacetylase [Firmicutes bacterium]|nr:O-acetyl-ADP-ribose deacetylase [Bacillota bacterium]
MPLIIVKNDITKMTVDAIVNAASPSLLGGGGVDGCIHRAAGPELLNECRTLGGCETGQAKATGAYNLPCKYVLHTVGPVWRDGRHGEKALLEACYSNSLALAAGMQCRTVAFPLISAGVYGYPADLALRVAVDTVSDFLLRNEMTVYIVIFDKAAYRTDAAVLSELTEYINSRDAAPAAAFYCREQSPKRAELFCQSDCALPDFKLDSELDRRLKEPDESFSQMLMRKIDEKGLTDVQCYKKANIDRKLFSKIRSDKHYRPGKTTAAAFAIALELSAGETEDLLRKAGYALSGSNKFDIIIQYFIDKGQYNVFHINEVLFAFDQPLLGGK